MKRFILNPGNRRRPLGGAMRTCSGKSAWRFAAAFPWLRRAKERSVCSAIIYAFLISSAFAQSDAQFAKANQEFAAGQFKEAIDDYEGLVRTGPWSANLFYDLGNAHFRNGNFGRAILNYERALALNPRHPEADANLRITRDEARALELTASRTERALRFMNLNQYAIAAGIAFWVGAFGIIALFFARRRSGRLLTMSILSLSIFAVAVAAIVGIDNGNRGRALAIVTDTGAEARVATADNANRVLTLPPGSEIRILSKRGDWIYAALPNNLRGWISAKSAESVRL
jgi:tetratricopeptide (TPR) repeat protein